MVTKKWYMSLSFTATILFAASLMQAAAPLEEERKDDEVRQEEDENEVRFGRFVSELPSELMKKIISFAKPATICDTHVESLMPHMVCSGVEKMAISADGKFFATKHRGDVRVWNTLKGTLLHTIVHAKNALALDISSNKKFIVTADSEWLDEDGNENEEPDYHLAQVYAVESGALLHTLDRGDESLVVEAAISPDNNRIVLANYRGASIWDADSGTLLHTLKSHEDDDIHSVIISPDSQYIATAAWNNSTLVFAMNGGVLLHEKQSGDGGVAFSGDGTLFAIGDTAVVEIDAADSGNRLQLFNNASRSLIFSGNRFLITCAKKYIDIFDHATGKVVRRFQKNDQTETMIAPEGRCILSRNLGGETIGTVWRLQPAMPPVAKHMDRLAAASVQVQLAPVQQGAKKRKLLHG